MDAKNQRILLFVILLVGALIIFIVPKNPVTFNAYGSTQSDCELNRQAWIDSGGVCYTDCFEVTSTLANCVAGYGDSYFTGKIGKWFYYDSAEENKADTCRSYYESRLTSGVARYVGLYNCVPTFKNVIGNMNIGNCTDTCSSLGKSCGSWSLCGTQTTCGTCQSGSSCNSNGQCIASGCSPSGSQQTCTASNACQGVQTCSSGSWGSCITGLTKCSDNTCKADCGGNVCTENWQCTEYSNCSSGTQTRTCTDSNACGNTSSKPTESQSCTENPENFFTKTIFSIGTFNVTGLILTIFGAFFVVLLISGGKRR